MALFKSLFKKEEPVSTVPPEDFPELFNGMKAEVLTPANARPIWSLDTIF